MNIRRKPSWLKTKLEAGEDYSKVKKIVDQHQLHTICSSGKCPNIGKCWSMGTATFMIAGDICTRSCKFCATKTGKPLPLDPNEPEKIARSVQLMQLKHCVITSVDRDDLDDKSAQHWAETILAIRKSNPQTTIEVLIPDFDADTQLLDIVFSASPDVLGHNMETIRRLTPEVRSKAQYNTSLAVLQYASQQGLVTKSGIMVGLGETESEVVEVMQDLCAVNCNLFTIGQYLQPTEKNIPVADYITPELFLFYKEKGLSLGFDQVESGPLVRSSFMAERTFMNAKSAKPSLCQKSNV